MQSPRAVPEGSSAPWKVLFCGREMHYGYVFTAEALADEHGVEVVQCDRDALAQEIRDADVAVPLMSRLDAALLRSAERLKLVIQYGVGVEGIDIPTASELGIWVSNILSTGTGNAISCAEHAIFLTLATLRDTSEMARSIQTRRLGLPLGHSLYGKTVLVVGFGGIAKELVVRLHSWGVRILALRRQDKWGQPTDELTQSAEAALADRGCWPDDTPRLAGCADVVVLTCHQDESSRGMVDVEFLGHCKPGVRIVNVARGGLLDYEAVQEALESGRISGMGLDVQEEEPIDADHWLTKHPKVYLTPHVAGVTEISYRSMAQVVAQEVRSLRKGVAPTRQLNQAVDSRVAATAARSGLEQQTPLDANLEAINPDC